MDLATASRERVSGAAGVGRPGLQGLVALLEALRTRRSRNRRLRHPGVGVADRPASREVVVRFASAFGPFPAGASEHRRAVGAATTGGVMSM